MVFAVVVSDYLHEVTLRTFGIALLQRIICSDRKHCRHCVSTFHVLKILRRFRYDLRQFRVC